MKTTKPEVESRDAGDDDDLAEGIIHDLAGALTAIRGWAELALDTPESVRPEVALELIRESASTASRLARTVSGRDPQIWADPLEVGHQVARLLRPASSQRAVQISVEAPAEALPELPEAACFSILWNLAHNAVMMTREGSTVSIRFGLGTTPDGVPTMGIRVVDSGPGMDDAAKLRAFDLGFSRRPGGTGLGLARMRRVTHQLGGQVRLGDAPDGGLSVDVTLPVARRPGSRTTRRSGVMTRDDARSTRLTGMRVLVIDDDDALRKMLVTSLTVRGASCDEAASVEETSALIGTDWNIALVDLGLSDGSGWVLAEQLRASGRAHSVVCMSGQTSLPPGTAFRPEGWLRKPFEPSEVVQTIARLAGPQTEHSAKAR